MAELRGEVFDDARIARADAAARRARSLSAAKTSQQDAAVEAHFEQSTGVDVDDIEFAEGGFRLK